MYVRKVYRIIACVLSLVWCTLSLSSFTFSQNETSDAKVIDRYKQMLERKPKAGSTFDRLYQFYLEGAGLDAMVADYETAALSNPNNPNLQLILGHIYKRLGKDNETVAAYQRAVELAPNNYYPYFALGQAYATLRQYANAITALTQAADYAIETKSATLDDLTALYKSLGRAYFRRDRVDEAILAWGKISELAPENIFARIELADLFREQELYAQAIEQHEAIVKFKADDPYRVCLSLREIGKIREEKGDYAGAIQSYDAALALTGQGNWLRKDIQHRVIGIYASDGDWEGLIAYYQDKLSAAPNDPELIGLLASAYIENQQLEDGIASYRKALELAPTDAGLRLNLIAAFRAAARFEDAAAEYERLSEEQPDDFGIYRELGELYLQLEDKVRAKGAYQRMIDRDPENGGTHLILAEIYAGHEWLDDAITAYEKAISLAPANLDYIEYFGEFYFRHGTREKTVETWNRMVAGDRAIAENYDRIAQLLDAKDFHTEAIGASRKAVELAPAEYRYREALARRLMRNKDYAEALIEYTEASKLAPNEFFAEQMGDQQIDIYRRQGTLVEKIDELEAAPESFDQRKQLTKMYLKLGNVTNALEILIQAKGIKPDNVQVNRRLADIYVQQGLRDEAVAIYKHLVEIDSANAREHYAKIAQSQLDTMDFDAATTAAKQAVAHSPRNPEGHQMLAEIAKQIGKYDTAADSLKQAIRLRPEAIEIREELAEIYKLSGNVRQAMEQYWRCWELSENVSDKLTFVKSLSNTYYDLGRGDEFEERLKQMSKANPSNVAPVLALAELFRMEGDLLGARFQLARALDRERNDPNLLAQLVEISRNLGDTQDALTYLQRLVKVQPDPFHQQRLGELLFDLGREQEAIQAWTKLLHSRNQTLEAEIKLAALLIRHGLLDEALVALDRAGEKVKDAKAIYQVGAALVEMNELDRARPHFLRILVMQKPHANITQTVKSRSPAPIYGPPGINIRKFSLAEGLVWRIRDQSYGGRSGKPWLPNSFEEAQAGALVQLTTIAQQQGKLGELIQKFEAVAQANPKDVQALERLAQLYTLTKDADKVAAVIERLIAASPKDPVYQAIRLSRSMEQKLEPDAFQKQLEGMTGLTPEARLWYAATYVGMLHSQGRKPEAASVLDNLEMANVTDINTGSALVVVLAQLGRVEAAERLLAQLQIPATPAGSQAMTGQSFAQQQWWQYVQIYQALAAAYVSEGRTDKGIDLFWTFFDRTKPNITHARRVATLAYSSHSYSGYTPIQSSYPSPTAYYDQTRLQYLQQVFSQFWMRNQQDAFFAKLQSKLDASKSRDRVFPGLALSYCYWWGGNRDKSQEILSALEREFPEDLTLKVNTVFASIQTGQHATALELLDALAGVDPRNRRQYYDLSLQLAAHTGNTVRVRELMTKVLNSPVGVRELYKFSQKLQETGLTQYAIVVAKKVMTLAMGQRDPNFLMELSSHLENLGRGQDATLMAERALRFANQRDRHGQTLHSWSFQQAAHLVSRSRTVREREPQLVEAAEKNPDSFQAQVRLASYYESTNQVKNASAAFDAALALRPKDSMIRQRYAQMLKRSGHAAEAVTQYIALLQNNPNALGYNYWEMMETFFQAGKVDELVSVAKDMIVPSVGQTHANYFAQNVADRCIENNNAKAAVQIYEKLQEVLPDGHNTYANLASAYAAAGEREKAIEFLRDKLESESTTISQNPHLQVGIVSKLTELYKASGNIESLLPEYEAKLVKEPSDAILLYLVASMKIAANDLEGSDHPVARLLDDEVVSVNAQRMGSLADAYRSAGDRDRELRLLEAATEKLDPQHSWQLTEIYKKLGVAYLHGGEKEKAKDAIRKMGMMRLMMYGGGGGMFWEKQEIANLYRQHEMWEDAEAMFTEIVNDLSADKWARDEAQRQLMEVKTRKGGFRTTTRLPEKLGEMARTNPGMQRMLAQQYMQQNELSKAAEIYEQIAESMPEDLESRAQLATIYSRQNKHELAIGTWQALLDADPENTKYQDGIVNSLREADRFPEALELAQKYIESEADSGVHYIRLARVYAAENSVDDAIEAFKQAIEFGPGDGRACRELAQLYLRKNDLDSAEKAFEQAIQYTGQEWERRDIERQLMGIYRRQGKLEEMLQKSEEEGTLTLEMQQERARGYRQNGKLQEAVHAFKKALDMTSQSWERNQISNELVQIYVQLGEHDLALELYETLSRSSSMGGMSIIHGSSGFKVNFGGDEARETLINAYGSQGQLEQLKTSFEKRMETEANNPAVVEMVAEIYRKNNDHKQAAEMYQALCEIQPGNVRSFYYAAAAYNKNDQPQLSKDLLEQGEVALSSSNRNQDMWFLAAVGSICLDGEMYGSAIKLVEDAIATIHWHSPWDKERLYDMLGKSYVGAKRYTEAVHAYQQMANVAQDDSQRKAAEAAMRRAYKEGDLYKALIDERTQAVVDSPNDPDTHFALAQSFEWNDMPGEAIAAYERASQLNPDSTLIMAPLAKLCLSTDPEKAKHLYRRLIELADTDRDRLHRRRALIDLHTRSGEYDAAIAEILNASRSVEDERGRRTLLPLLWDIYKSQGRSTEGIATLETLAIQLPDSPTPQKVLGDVYKEIGNPEKSDAAYIQWVGHRQESLDKMQDWRGRNWGYGDLVAELLAKRVLPEKTVELAEHALQLDANPRNKTTLGKAYVFNRQPAKVKKLIQSASNLQLRHELVLLLSDYYERLGKIDVDVVSMLRANALHASTPTVKNAALKGLWDLYEAAARPSQANFVGNSLPPIRFYNLNGEEITLSDFEGKVVLLNFWATWCPPSVRGIPQFLAFQEQHEAAGLVVVGVSVDREGEDVVKSFVEKHGVDYPNLIARQDAAAEFGGLASLPSTFLINRDGIIVKQYVGFTDQSVYLEDIKTVLAE